MEKGQYWNAADLAVALAGTDEVASGAMSVVFRSEGVIEVTLHECGDLSVLIGVEGKEIQASVLLDPVETVRDPSAFQNRLLRANKLLPLSTFGITEVAGRSHYEIFGQLSGGSELEEIVEEIETLGRNAIEAVQMIIDWNKG